MSSISIYTWVAIICGIIAMVISLRVLFLAKKQHKEKDLGKIPIDPQERYKEPFEIATIDRVGKMPLLSSDEVIFMCKFAHRYFRQKKILDSEDDSSDKREESPKKQTQLYQYEQ